MSTVERSRLSCWRPTIGYLRKLKEYQISDQHGQTPQQFNVASSKSKARGSDDGEVADSMEIENPSWITDITAPLCFSERGVSTGPIALRIFRFHFGFIRVTVLFYRESL